MKRTETLEAESAAEWGVTSFDPWDPRITSEVVWQMYRAMRQAGPALRSDAHGGFWAITRYGDIRAAAADPATFSSARGTVIGRTKQVPSIPLEFDRPEHTAYRKALQAPFLRSRVEEFRKLVRAEVAELLDGVAQAGRFDIVGDIAAQLPLKIISEFLGIRGERQVLHQRLGHNFVHADISTVAGAEEAYYAFIRQEVRARSTELGEDFISELVQTDVEGRRFEEQEIVRMTRALALAGHHTTINGISSMLVRMADPEARSRYLEGEVTAAQVVEEALRIDPPIHLEARTTTMAADVGGVTIPAGQKVGLLYASGNHDDEVYSEPERFDPGREAPANLTFGHGVHKCLGQHLSILEMTVVLEAMLERFPVYQLTAEPRSVMVYGHHMAWPSIPAVTG